MINIIRTSLYFNKMGYVYRVIYCFASFKQRTKLRILVREVKFIWREQRIRIEKSGGLKSKRCGSAVVENMKNGPRLESSREDIFASVDGK